MDDGIVEHSMTAGNGHWGSSQSETAREPSTGFSLRLGELAHGRLAGQHEETASGG